MKQPAFLFVHKDHPFRAAGVNSGAETATIGLARALVKLGNRVVVCGQLKDGEQIHQGVEYWDLGTSYDVVGAIERARELGSYHLIVACRCLALIVAEREASCISRTFIAHDPSAGAIGISPRVLSDLVDNILCVSEAQKAMLIKEGALAERVRVVTNGADLDLFSVGVPEKRDFQRLLFVGALVTDKGVDILIEAYINLLQEFPNIKLDVFGSAALWGREEIIDSREITKHFPQIVFHGEAPQERVAEAYRTSGICVISSRWFEALSLTSVEAQVSGCPVVAFDVGGVKETFIDGETGALVPTVSVEALTEQLRALLRNPRQLLDWSRNASREARKKYNWIEIAGRISTLCGSSRPNNLMKGRLGILSTWDQPCGLAKVAEYLVREFQDVDPFILGEDLDEASSKDRGENISLCWSRKSSDYRPLQEVIRQKQLRCVILNCQPEFFEFPKFRDCLEELRREGVKFIAYLHNTYTLKQNLHQLATTVDAVVVHTPENRLEAIANGSHPQTTYVVPHGVEILPSLSVEERQQVRSRYGVEPAEKLIFTFGFIQPHKGIERVIEAVHALAKNGSRAKGIIAGQARDDDPNSKAYAQALASHASQLGIGERIQFINQFLPDDQINDLLRAADAVYLNYRSDYYESSGVASRAVGAGALLVTSNAPAMASFGDSVWHATSGFPPEMALTILLENEEVRKEQRRKACQFAQQNSWNQTARRFYEVMKCCGFHPVKDEGRTATVANERKDVEIQRTMTHSNRPRSILFQNRSNAYSQPGGDTILMDRYQKYLTQQGIKVTVDLQGREDPSQYDLVHLFNFVLPDMVREYGRRAYEKNIPFVVTTLSEDAPEYVAQAVHAANTLTQYVNSEKQDRIWLNDQMKKWPFVTPMASFDNLWTAKHAAALLPNGEAEARSLRKAYGDTSNIRTIPIGFDMPSSARKEEFIRQYGVEEFVLCVGRLEFRKNQLMLLHALEESEIPVVLAAGGFSYVPEYEQAVRAFRRKGKTIITDRLSDEMLASAYAAARVHALPSWYELPGLVSLEAAWHGCNVVATDNGTARDYFQDHAVYCDPSNPSSIRNGVMAAYYQPRSPQLKERVEQYTWERAGRELMKVYENVLAPSQRSQLQMQLDSSLLKEKQTQVGISATGNETVAVCITRAEESAANGDFTTSEQWMKQAEKKSPNDAWVLRSKGAISLAQSKYQEALPIFQRALGMNPTCSRSLTGAGMCEAGIGNYPVAYDYFVRATTEDPDHLVALNQLLRISYLMEKFEDLIRALKGYLASHPTNNEMRFCLAGAFYKQGDWDKAEIENSLVMSSDSRHAGAQQLKNLLAQEKAKSIPASSPPPIQESKPSPIQSKFASEFTEVRRSISSSSAEMPAEEVLVQLEEEKRSRNFQNVLDGCRNLLQKRELHPAHQLQAKLLQAEVYVLDGKISTAEEIYAEVLRTQPSSARALCGRGAIAASQNEWNKAEALFREANRFDPRFDVALAGLGLCSHYAKDTLQAWNWYIEALKMNPENLRALLGVVELGYGLGKLGEVEWAIKEYLELHPADLDFVYSLAGCYLAQERLDEAVEEINKITLFRPDDEKAIELQKLVAERRSTQSSSPSSYRSTYQ